MEKEIIICRCCGKKSVDIEKDTYGLGKRPSQNRGYCQECKEWIAKRGERK